MQETSGARSARTPHPVPTWRVTAERGKRVRHTYVLAPDQEIASIRAGIKLGFSWWITRVELAPTEAQSAT